MKIEYILTGVAVVAILGATAVWVFDSDNPGNIRRAKGHDGSVGIRDNNSAIGKPEAKKVGRDGLAAKDVMSGELRGMLWSSPEDDERELTDLEKKILDELSAALERNDLRSVRRAIAKFYAPKESGGLNCRVPKELRKHALEALVWFRPDTISDLISFMVDGDPEVVEDAFAKFEMELDDASLGDRERAQVLTKVMTALTDEERIDSLLMQLNDMRNSVKAETALTIMSTGSSQAKAMMKDQVGFYFDAEVEDAEGVTNWQQANPDDETDDEFYGPEKSEQSTENAPAKNAGTSVVKE